MGVTWSKPGARGMGRKTTQNVAPLLSAAKVAHVASFYDFEDDFLEPWSWWHTAFTMCRRGLWVLESLGFLLPGDSAQGLLGPCDSTWPSRFAHSARLHRTSDNHEQQPHTTPPPPPTTPHTHNRANSAPATHLNAK